jgi:competence protein ComEC
VGVLAVAASRRGLPRRLACLTAVGALVGVELAAIRAGRPTGELRVTAIDVEQGDATLVDLPDGTLMLVDGGGFVGSPVDPGRQVLLPLLRARRRDHVDIVVLSHPHPDHFGGLATALPSIGVGALWDSGQGRSEGAGPVFAAMLSDLERRGVPILGPSALCGRERHHGGAVVRVLGPCPTFTPGINANDNSIVVHIRYGERAVLLTGDAEAHQEAELVAQYGDSLRADLLKVGHHGSRTSSTPPFVARVRPAFATISCGVRNRYGHPHAVTLETLDRAGVSAFRLDRTGSVTFATDGSAVRIAGFSEAR